MSKKSVRGQVPCRRAIQACLFCMGLAGALSAQTTTQTQVRSGTVVYTIGNDLVIKMDDGTVKHLVVPDSATAEVDGKTVTVHDLKPGMHLSKTITTTTTNESVTNVRIVKGKVWFVSPPSNLIVTLANGQNKQYKVPDGMKFNVDGQQVTAFDLKKGMNLVATVVTTTPQTVVSSNSQVTGTAPVMAAAPKPATPPMVGALLIEDKSAPAVAPPPVTASNEAPEPAPKKLPKTAGYSPLLGLIALCTLLTGLALRARRLYQ